MPDVQRLGSAPGCCSTHVVFGPDGELVLTVALAKVPAKSPYQVGDWVIHHGYPAKVQPGRSGWRGYVTGWMGSTLLRGVTDEGREWCEHWGALLPDGVHRCRSARCLCCPHPRRPDEIYQQTGLFDLAEVAT